MFFDTKWNFSLSLILINTIFSNYSKDANHFYLIYYVFYIYLWLDLVILHIVLTQS